MDIKETYQFWKEVTSFLPDFLDYLQREGFAIDIDTHVHLISVLKTLPSNTSIERLKTILSPLLVDNEKDQERFYRLFDDYFTHVKSVSHKETIELGATKAIETETRSKKYLIVGLFITALLLLVANIYFYSPTNENITPSNETTELKPEGNNIETDSIINNIASDKPQELQKTNNWLIRLFTSIVLILGTLFYEWYRWKKRKLISEKERSNAPPFVWDIQSNEDYDIDYGEDFGIALKQLRKRKPSDNYALNIPSTINATIQKGGTINLQYRNATQSIEYLMLIDESSIKNHQSQLFSHLHKLLLSNEIYIERFYYDGDPRVCWNERHSKGVRLEQLSRKYSNYRLLIFGNVNRFIDPTNGQLQQWTNIFNHWQEKAVLTPTSVSLWGQDEAVLANFFTLFPSDINGLIEVVNTFEHTSNKGLKPWEFDSVPFNSTINLDNEPNLLNLLEKKVGKPMTQWIAACAIYPELNWSLTLQLGKLLSNEQNNLLTINNLLEISRLEWFKQGEIPDDIRRELISYLPEEVQNKVRTSIIGLMEKQLPPKESHAYNDVRMQLVIQKLLLHPNQHKPELEEEYEELLESNIDQDFTVIKYLNRQSPSSVDFIIPDNLKKKFFNRGHVFFGIKSWLRISLVMLSVLALIDWGSIINRIDTEVQRSIDKIVDLENLNDFSAFAKSINDSIAKIDLNAPNIRVKLSNNESLVVLYENSIFPDVHSSIIFFTQLSYFLKTEFPGHGIRFLGPLSDYQKDTKKGSSKKTIGIPQNLQGMKLIDGNNGYVKINMDGRGTCYLQASVPKSFFDDKFLTKERKAFIDVYRLYLKRLNDCYDNDVTTTTGEIYYYDEKLEKIIGNQGFRGF